MMAGGREGRGGVECPADVERWWGRRRRIKVKGGSKKCGKYEGGTDLFTNSDKVIGD